VGPGSRSVAVGASRGAGGCSEERPWYSGLRRGASRGRRWLLRRATVVLRSAPWCRAGCRWLLRRATWYSAWRRCLQTPWGQFASPRGGWVVGPVVRLAAPPRGVGSSGRREGLRCSSEEGRQGSWGCAAGGCCLSEEGRRCRLRPWVRPPEGGWAHFGPRWRRGPSRASPVWSVGRRASAFRGRSSACIA
jgi:hypothetical protein